MICSFKMSGKWVDFVSVTYGSYLSWSRMWCMLMKCKSNPFKNLQGRVYICRMRMVLCKLINSLRGWIVPDQWTRANLVEKLEMIPGITIFDLKAQQHSQQGKIRDQDHDSHLRKLKDFHCQKISAEDAHEKIQQPCRYLGKASLHILSFLFDMVWNCQIDMKRGCRSSISHRKWSWGTFKSKIISSQILENLSVHLKNYLQRPNSTIASQANLLISANSERQNTRKINNQRLRNIVSSLHRHLCLEYPKCSTYFMCNLNRDPITCNFRNSFIQNFTMLFSQRCHGCNLS